MGTALGNASIIIQPLGHDLAAEIYPTVPQHLRTLKSLHAADAGENKQVSERDSASCEREKK